MKKYVMCCLASTVIVGMSSGLVCAKAVRMDKSKALSIEIPISDASVFDNPLYNPSAISPVHSAQGKDEIKLVKRVQDGIQNLIGHFNDHKRLQVLYDAAHGMLAEHISFAAINLPGKPLLVDTLLEHQQKELVKQILKTQSYTLSNGECLTIISNNDASLIKLMIKSPWSKTGEQRVRIADLLYAAYNRAIEQYSLDQYQAKNLVEVMEKKRAHAPKVEATVSTGIFQEFLQLGHVTAQDLQTVKKRIVQTSQEYHSIAKEFVRLLDEKVDHISGEKSTVNPLYKKNSKK